MLSRASATRPRRDGGSVDRANGLPLQLDVKVAVRHPVDRHQVLTHRNAIRQLFSQRIPSIIHMLVIRESLVIKRKQEQKEKRERNRKRKEFINTPRVKILSKKELSSKMDTIPYLIYGTTYFLF